MADSFFVRKDCLELFQKRLADIAQLSGISDSTVIAAFSSTLAGTHDALADARPQEGFEQTAGLTASRISLMGLDDLDLEIRINDILARLRENDRIDHWRAQLRYMTLLQRPRMTPEQNPIGLSPICEGLWAICREDNSTLDQKLERLDRLEELLQLRLPDLYTELNALLERYGIEAAPVPIARGTSGGVTQPEPVGQGITNALTTLHNAIQLQAAGGANAELADAALTLPAGANSNAALNATALVMLNQLTARLTTLELQQLTLADTTDGQPRRPLSSRDLDLPPGTPATVALDTLALIFDAIFSSPDLPDTVKTAIGRLQIPLLKQAILDPTFFANTDHPARRLINRMARAAIGLPADTRREHPVCTALVKLADAVRTQLESNDNDLTPLLDQLEALIDTRDRSLKAAADPYTDVVTRYERREAAKSSAQNWLDRTRPKAKHSAIATFLESTWLPVMQLACLNGGTAGAYWKESAETIESLLWSIEPKNTPGERKLLTARLPDLIKRINTGLDWLKIPDDDRRPFLDTFFALQTAALRGQALSAPEARPNATAATPQSPDDTSGTPPYHAKTIERGGKFVRYVSHTTTPPAKNATGTAIASLGDWIDFQLADGNKGKRLCGLYCWQAAASGTALLFSPGWGYAVAMAPDLLDRQLRSGEARIVSNGRLFDEAAEHALARLGQP